MGSEEDEGPTYTDSVRATARRASTSRTPVQQEVTTLHLYTPADG